MLQYTNQESCFNILATFVQEIQPRCIDGRSLRHTWRDGSPFCLVVSLLRRSRRARRHRQDYCREDSEPGCAATTFVGRARVARGAMTGRFDHDAEVLRQQEFARLASATVPTLATLRSFQPTPPRARA